MNKREIYSGIDQLIDSGKGYNSSLAISLMVSQLGCSLLDALKYLKPQFTSGSSENLYDFEGQINISNLTVVYENNQGYVPYMGSENTSTRLVKIENNGKIEMIDSLLHFLEVQDCNNEQEIKELMLEDYYSIIPEIIDLLKL